MPPVVPVEAEEANVENSSSPSTPSALDIDAVPFSPHSASNLPEQQSQNDVGSPVSSFHFPPNVPNAGLQQEIAHQSDVPIAPVSPSSENISMSHNDSMPPDEADVQQQNNPAFDGVRRSSRERTPALHPDAEYFNTLQAEEQAKANLCLSVYSSKPICLQCSRMPSITEN